MSREEAIQKLKENKEVCVETSAFGDDNIAALDAMIEVLEEGYDEDEVYEKFEDVSSVLGAALSALELEENGFENIEQYLYPVR